MSIKPKKILAFIPARGGSKGIPNKNIVDLNGKPLIAWTIDEAKKSKYIDKIVVFSQDKKILAAAKLYGAETIKRPKELATDNVSPEPSLTHALKILSTKKYTPDIIIYLEPTSPLRTVSDIDGALEKFLNSKATALISVYKLDKKLLKSFKLTGQGYLVGTVNNRYPFANRQSLPEIYLSSGSIYIIDRKTFLKDERLYSTKTIPYHVDSDSNIDLDTVADLERVRELINKRKITI